MTSWFLNIKNKPEESRKRYAFFISFTLTFIIIIIWLFSTLFKNDSKVNGDLPQEVSTPTESLKSTSASALNSIKTLLNGSIE